MNIRDEALKTLVRIKQKSDHSNLSKKDLAVLDRRLERQFPRLFELLFEIYGHRYDFYYHLQQLVEGLYRGYEQRNAKLKQLDKTRLKNPLWYQDHKMVGMAVYVDLFAGDLNGLKARIPYLKELGITYLHLMPLYKVPNGDSDGGYAVSDYRVVNPELGTIDALRSLADSLRDAGISLVLDFVFNHTSDEHKWAQSAQSGDKDYQEFYYTFDNKNEPDQYEQNLREIFPQVRRGNFTFDDKSKKWVWTTFNSFQWDLNYTNPAVFSAIVDEMLFLANLGCEALRLDALAFIWKEKGTSCENQPNAHKLIRAFNLCLQISAPAVVFKSEAIVHPDEVNKYIDQEECQLSYNPLLMALLWNSLATRKTRLLTKSMHKSFSIPGNTSWVNYIRCHDDIGWTFDDGIASQLGINGNDHRHFLNQFYTGRFEGSFASGVAFADNPSTGDCRVCGSLASLAGLEKAIDENDQSLIDQAVKRILLLHSVILSIGGIPLLYSGDELGLLNDYQYRNDPSKKHDDRWVQRIALSEKALQQIKQPETPQHDINRGISNMISLRKKHQVFGSAETRILDAGNHHVFSYVRQTDEGHQLLALCNFSEHDTTVDGRILGHINALVARDLLNDITWEQAHPILLSPYQVMWLVCRD